jgi:molybdopterin-guanine dinucleotide biosynthesis protein A
MFEDLAHVDILLRGGAGTPNREERHRDEEVAGLVLTGGRSRRMGRDKALLELDGDAFAVRVARAMVEAGCAPVVAVGGDVDALRARGLDALVDPRQGAGPLGGILSGIEALAAMAPSVALVVVCACDLPLLGSGEVRAVLDEARRTGRAAVARTDRVEPLCGAWPIADVRRAAGELFDAGHRSVRALVERLDAVTVDVASDRLRNVNTPGDLPPGSVAAMAIPEVTVDELASRIAAGAVVVDVRELDEYVAGHVPGALLFPLSTLVERAGELPAADPLFVVCRSGARSMRACEYLAGHGRSVANVAGGTLAWLDSGREAVAGADPS